MDTVPLYLHTLGCGSECGTRRVLSHGRECTRIASVCVGARGTLDRPRECDLNATQRYSPEGSTLSGAAPDIKGFLCYRKLHTMLKVSNGAECLRKSVSARAADVTLRRCLDVMGIDIGNASLTEGFIQKLGVLW